MINNNNVFVIIIVICSLFFVKYVESLRCVVDVNSNQQYNQDNLSGCCYNDGENIPPPCKSIDEAKNSILNKIHSKTDNYLSITLNSGVFFASQGNSLFLSEDFLSTFSSIELIGATSGNMTVIDGTQYTSGSFISNQLIVTNGQYIELNIKNFNFRNWDDTSENPIISFNTNSISNFDILVTNCDFRFIDRQILSINGNSNSLGQKFTFEQNIVISVGSSKTKYPIELQNVASDFNGNTFKECSSDSGVFISSNIGKIDDVGNKYIKTTFFNNVVQNSTITNSGNGNKLKESDGFISVSNSYFIVFQSTFNCGYGRLISFDTDQLQQNKNLGNMYVILQIEDSKFNNNSVGSSIDGEDSLINIVSYPGNWKITYRSEIKKTNFYSQLENELKSNSIIKTLYTTFELKGSNIIGNTQNTAFSCSGSYVMLTDSTVNSDRLIIGKYSTIEITDSNIPSDHSQYKLCSNCEFNYTSSYNNSLNWNIETGTYYDIDLTKGWKEIGIITVSSFVFVIVAFGGTIFIISIINKRKQQQIQSNTYVKLQENIQLTNHSDNYEIGDVETKDI